MPSGPAVSLDIGTGEILAHPLFRNPDKWSKDLVKRINEDIGGHFKRWIAKMKKEITPTIAEGATGNLKKSYKGTPVIGKGIDMRASFGSDVRYAAWHEFGTGPHFPPIDALVPWVIAKGMVSEGDPEYLIRGVAFLIARVISRRGTIPGNELENWFAKNEVTIIKETVALADKIVTEEYLNK
ncbi:MAG: hypothetical protein ACYS1A_19535 [Planctomycetota bacterium]|jgi:hypothetical protein